MATTKISTENARSSLNQNIEALYTALHTGGAFNSKTDTGQNDTYNQRVTSLQSRHNTPKGFKIRMKEGLTEFFMARDSKVVTTAMRTSVYGDHSNKKYWPM